MKKIIRAAFLAAAAAILLFPSASNAEGTFKTYHARHSTLWYKVDGDFALMEEALHEGPGGCFSPHGPDSRWLAGRIDALFERVEFLLGMYPVDLHVRLAVFSDSAELSGEYERIGLGSARPDPYYNSRGRILYISAENADVNTLARGIARAVTAEHFRACLPPGAMEVIDRYLEEQLSQGY